jgi:hypothetical protein
MKTTNRMRLRKVLLSVLLCFTVYLSLAVVLFNLNLPYPLAS